MGWTPPSAGIAMCQGSGVETNPTGRRHPMKEVSIIGIDLSKNSFQVHGAYADGSVAFRRKLTRARMLAFLSSQPRCLVAMEACGSAHYWGREIGRLGHEVRLIPPVYVKAYVKRQKNDAADAEAICEAASRPTMHFVAVKSEERPGGDDAVRGPRPSGAPAHADDQCAAGPFGGVRCDCAEGSGSRAPSGAGDRGPADEPAGEGARAGRAAAGADCRPRPEDRGAGEGVARGGEGR